MAEKKRERVISVNKALHGVAVLCPGCAAGLAQTHEQCIQVGEGCNPNVQCKTSGIIFSVYQESKSSIIIIEIQKL